MDPDLVDPGMFLRGCEEPLEQYRECLMTNLKDWHGRGLHRGKLSMVKIHHLGQMNITRFDHQKLIMARIRRLSEIPSMPKRGPDQSETAELEAAVHLPRPPQQARRLSNVSSQGSTSQGPSDESTTSGAGGGGTKERDRRRSVMRAKAVRGGRRGSLALDKSWDAINKSRAQADGAAKQKQLGSIRRRKSNIGLQPPDLKPLKPSDFEFEPHGEDGNDSLGAASIDSFGQPGGKGTGSRRQSMSIHNPDPARQARIEAAKAKRQRAIEYGNSALKATVREGNLKDLKKQILADFVSTIGCDRATLMFVDTPSQELFFFDGNARISFPLRKGIAGHCAATGIGVIVNDPYSNEHFNSQIDKDTGFLTKNMLCAPIKSRRGGNVVAVLQMVNKKGDQDFTEQDADVMEMCNVKVAHALDTTFSALVAAENDWAKTAGRRGSVGSNGSSGGGAPQQDTDAADAATGAEGGVGEPSASTVTGEAAEKGSEGGGRGGGGGSDGEAGELPGAADVVDGGRGWKPLV